MSAIEAAARECVTHFQSWLRMLNDCRTHVESSQENFDYYTHELKAYERDMGSLVQAVEQAETHPGAVVNIDRYAEGRRDAIAECWRKIENARTAKECRDLMAELGSKLG